MEVQRIGLLIAGGLTTVYAVMNLKWESQFSLSLLFIFSSIALLSNSPCAEIARTKKAMIKGQRKPANIIKMNVINTADRKKYLFESSVSVVNTGENPAPISKPRKSGHWDFDVEN